jgi:oligoribonuclease (3'-5' exoribonuclease)
MTPNNEFSPDQRLVWIDCEMTGLDLIKNRLLEIACIITEGDLKVNNYFILKKKFF